MFRKFIKSILLVAITLPVSYGQELVSPDITKSQLEMATYFEADDASVTKLPDGGVRVYVTGFKNEQIVVALVAVPYPEPLVRAYKYNADSFRPVVMQDNGTGVFVLDQPGKWDIEVLAVVDGSWKFDFFDKIIIPPSGSVVDPPIDPPVDPPVSTYDQLTKDVTEIMVDLNDAPMQLKYYNALTSIVWTGTIEQMATQVKQKRADTFRGRINAPWGDKFFTPINSVLMTAETSEQYAAMWQAIIKGLKPQERLSTITSSIYDKPSGLTEADFPVNPTIGDKFGGYECQQTCDPVTGVCSLVWVRVNN